MKLLAPRQNLDVSDASVTAEVELTSNIPVDLVTE